jgi:hypothetical protein
MYFEFNIKSEGVSDNVEDDKNLCFYWKLGFLYNARASGQIMVSSTSTVDER